MADVGLLYVGAVLYVNALMLLGKVEAKSASIFNLFVGGLQVVTPIYLIFTTQNLWTIFNASGLFLFGFTYLYVGITNMCDLDTTGLGWYCLWVSILAVGFSLVNFVHFGDVKFGVIWLLWAFLWWLFYLLLGQQKDIAVFTGWITMIEAWITCTIPAFLSMTGLWNFISPLVTWIITILVVLTFIVTYLKTRTVDSKDVASA